MGRAKIAINIDEQALAELDLLVSQGVFPDRNAAVESAIRERIDRSQRASRLAQEAAKLDQKEEQALAEEWYAGESAWPEY